MNKKPTILIADDEREIRDIVTLLLKGEGYDIVTAENGKQVVESASQDIDLYILDVNMPELSGFMAAAEIRKKYDAPIIFLTAYSGESDKVMGFTVGADDYIVKPFSNMELLMRVKAVLRRSQVTRSKEAQVQDGVSITESDGMNGVRDKTFLSVNVDENQISIGDVVLDLNSQSVLKDGETIPLTYTEFKILELLATHKKKIYSLDNIYQSIWEEEAVSDSAIMVHIKNIRKKLGDNSRNPKYIKTAWGRGYYIEG